MKKHFLVLFIILSQFLSAQDSLVIFESNFDLDARRLSSFELNRLDSLVNLYPMSAMKKVEIYGHTDSLAGVEYNKLLSKDRVVHILNYLERKGLSPLKAKTDFFGEEKPKYANSPKTRFKNRRVEIHFHIALASIPKPDEKLSEIQLKAGDKVQIPKLNFVGNQAIPVWESFDILKELLLLLQQNPDLEIELQGHVCCSDNIELSQERARSVYDFLRFNGIPAKRMSFRGFSNRHRLNMERTSEEKAQNRRVEILVKKNSELRVIVENVEEFKIDLRSRVQGVEFIENSARLTPSGDFNLAFILEMIQESKGLKYEFLIYDNIENSKMTKSRVKAIQRKLKKYKVSSVCKIKIEEKPEKMPLVYNNNFIILKTKK